MKKVLTFSPKGEPIKVLIDLPDLETLVNSTIEIELDHVSNSIHAICKNLPINSIIAIPTQ